MRAFVRLLTIAMLAAAFAGVGLAANSMRAAEPPLITGKLVTAPASATTEVPQPTALIAGADGALWFCEGHRIGRMTTAGDLSHYKLPVIGEADAIAAGPGGSIWFASENAVGRLTRPGLVVSLKGANARDLTLGPDGNMWIAESGAGKIARVTPSGSVKEFAAWPLGFQPEGIVRGPDGRLWITDKGNDAIVVMTVGGRSQTYRTPSRDSHPTAIIAGKDGNLWFTETNADAIGRVSPSGSFKEYPVHSSGGRDPKYNPYPGALAWGPDGNIWFTEATADLVRRLSPSGNIKDFPTATPEVTPLGIAAGSDGNIWFSENAAAAIGRATPAGETTAYDLVRAKPYAYVPEQLAAAPRGLWLSRGYDQFSLGLLASGGDFREVSRAVAVWDLTSDADGNAWFFESAKNKIASMSPAGSLTEYDAPKALSDFAVTHDSIWFTDAKFNKILHFVPSSHKLDELAIPTLESQPRAIAVDAAGNAWFTEWHGNKIGRVTPAGAITEYRIPWEDFEPGPIAVTPSGTVWFGQTTYYGGLASMSPAGKFSKIALSINANSDGPICVVADRAGSVWFAVESYPSSIVGRLSPSGKLEKFAIPTPQSYARNCALSADGDFWFTERTSQVSAGTIGKVTPLGVVSEYAIR